MSAPLGDEILEVDRLHLYKVEECIGTGHHSRVFRATYTPDGTQLALKTVVIFEVNSRAERRDCVREAKLLRRLNHPSIIRCYDAWIQNGELHLALEYGSHGDLHAFLKEYKNAGSQVPEGQIWFVVYQIVIALLTMKAHNVMHRDLKPANLFLTADGLIKLGDLDLSRFFSTSKQETNTVVGTPFYMSPEVINRHNYSYSADIWSLGCVVYEMCQLHSPFWKQGRNDLYNLGLRIQGGTYEPLGENVSIQMRQMVDSMLQTNPESRPTLENLLPFVKELALQHGVSPEQLACVAPPQAPAPSPRP